MQLADVVKAARPTVLMGASTVAGRGLHSFPIQLNLSSSVHRMTQLSSSTCPRVAQVELQRGRV